MTSSVRPSMRTAWLLGFLACAGLIAYALYVQYYQYISPCPLCILQRIAFIGMGVVFLIGGLHAPRSAWRRVYAALLALFAAGGIGVAVRQLWLQSLPADQVPSCGPGLGYMLDTFPLAQTLKMVLSGSGECAEVHWRFLGLAMPAWSLISLLVLGIWALWTARRPRRPRLFR
ncbi:MAG: disulfide bond formation protein B [Rhodanobacteraceae bacterium]